MSPETPAAPPATPAIETPAKPADDTRDDAAAYIRARAAQAEGAPPAADPAAPPAPDGEKPPEAPKPPAKAEKKPPPKSSQDHAWTRRERALSKREEQIAAREQAHAEREASHTTQLAELDKMNEAELIAWAAKRRGVSAKQVLINGAHLISGKKPPEPEKPPEDPRVTAMQEKLDRLEAERENSEYRQAETAWRAHVEDLAFEAEETYPHLTALSREEVSAKALGVWKQYAHKMGVAPELSAVLEHLESEEAEAFERTRSKLAEREQKRSGSGNGAGSTPEAQAAGSRTGTRNSPSAPTARSVSNADAAHPATSTRVLSERERVDDLADFFRSRKGA